MRRTVRFYHNFAIGHPFGSSGTRYVLTLATELNMRRVRYGARGVHVHGYRPDALRALAARSGLEVKELRPLDRAGYLAHFSRPADR